jgi:hypothetical protein
MPIRQWTDEETIYIRCDDARELRMIVDALTGYERPERQLPAVDDSVSELRRQLGGIRFDSEGGFHVEGTE